MAKYKWWKHKRGGALRGQRYTLPTFETPDDAPEWRQEYLAEFPDREITPVHSPGRELTDVTTRMAMATIQNELESGLEVFINSTAPAETVANRVRDILESEAARGIVQTVQNVSVNNNQIDINLTLPYQIEMMNLSIQLENYE